MEQATLDTARQLIQDNVWQKISELRVQLEANDPKIAGHISVIHTDLNKYEELVHLLSDEQIREIIAAQKGVTGTMLVQKVQKTSVASLTRQAKSIKAEDL